jgi:hypothetical protein
MLKTQALLTLYQTKLTDEGRMLIDSAITNIQDNIALGNPPCWEDENKIFVNLDWPQKNVISNLCGHLNILINVTDKKTTWFLFQI